MKNLLWLFVMFSFLGCTSPREKWYNQMIDSLNRLDFPPRVLDTLLFNVLCEGDYVDTIYPNGIHQIIQYFNGNYISYIRHKDSLIRDVLEYDTIDAKLLTWHKEYMHGEGIGSDEIFYLKDGNVEVFGPNMWYNSAEGYVEPGYSIYRLISKLKSEKLDLLNNSSIYYGPKEYYNLDSTLNHIKWCWQVQLRDTIGNPELNVVERLYDGQTGAFIDSSRIQERWRYDDWKY